MTLPQINAPVFTIELPSNKKKIKYRPFLVKEEKMFLMASLSDKEEDKYNALTQMLTNCTFGEIDVENLPIFDMEFLFLKLRGSSKGMDVPLQFTCNNTIENKENDLVSQDEIVCGTTIPMKYSLDNIKVESKENHVKKILITDTIGVVMKYPTMKDSIDLQSIADSGDISKLYDLIPNLIDSVYDTSSEEVFDSFSKEEMITWLENLETTQFNKIQNFFETMPTLRGEIKVKCPSCGHTEVVVLEGIQSFLDY